MPGEAKGRHVLLAMAELTQLKNFCMRDMSGNEAAVEVDADLFRGEECFWFIGGSQTLVPRTPLAARFQSRVCGAHPALKAHREDPLILGYPQ